MLEARRSRRGQIPGTVPANEGARVLWGACMRYQPGLRLKFNLVLVPLIAAATLMMVWTDYHHEIRAVMESHALHTTEVRAAGPVGPLDLATLPETVARRSLRTHVVYGMSMLAVLVLAVNAALEVFVLRGVNRIRGRIANMERGDWRGSLEPTAEDELGRLFASFQVLGLEIDALVGQLLQAERLAVLALVSKKLAGQVGPAVRDLGLAAGRLHQERDDSLRGTAAQVSGAAATILSAVRELDRAFPTRPGGTEPPLPAERAAGAERAGAPQRQVQSEKGAGTWQP